MICIHVYVCIVLHKGYFAVMEYRYKGSKKIQLGRWESIINVDMGFKLIFKYH